MFSSWHRIPCFTKYTYKYVRITYVFFPPEFWPEFLSPEFWTKLILPWNDLIPTCVPTESGNAAEFRGFRKMTPSRNRNRNGMHILDWIYVIGQRQCLRKNCVAFFLDLPRGGLVWSFPPVSRFSLKFRSSRKRWLLVISDCSLSVRTWITSGVRCRF